ncbi:hypothetical protein BJX61DRAFT_544275 [Aspergillus egyptiacus]|nr:hypothetical protein BJX61DRAFT_544275 [Aspergillus egyptiacus]
MADGSPITISVNDFTNCILCGFETLTDKAEWLDFVRVLFYKKGTVRISEVFSTYHYNAVAGSPESDTRIHLCPKSDDDYNAYNKPGLEEILKGAKQRPQPSKVKKARKRKASRASDCFERLPLEIREQIASLLPTSDFLNLRLVSPSIALVFHDNLFWKLRFSKDGERGYLHYLLKSSTENPVDWCVLYHATSKNKKDLDIRVRVWEVNQWIKETIIAEAESRPPPLDFHGRALQHYHNSSPAGTRVERAKIPSFLYKIAITIVSGQMMYRQEGSYSSMPPGLESATEIVALEFLDCSGNSVTLGTKYPNAKTRHPHSLRRSLEKYECANSSKPCPFDEGVRILFDASFFRGFSIRYTSEGITSIGVLPNLAEDPVFGYDANGCGRFDMKLDRVVEVVATWEGHALVDLGIRGHQYTAKSREAFNS